MHIQPLKTARAVHPNAGLAARYRNLMLASIDEMVGSVEHEVAAAYIRPTMATDAKPVATMRKLLADLGKRWIKRFDLAAPKIAEAYLKGSFKATDSAMRMALKDAGWTVKFEMTPAVKEIYEASLAENIGLIRSIPQEYLQQVQGVAMRSFVAGHDLHAMVKDLKRLYPQAANRAVLIARDQTNKANAVVTRARQIEVGIVEAIWMHSHAGKTPRPDHVAANGRRYKVAEGCYISGEYILPGEKINCRCTGRSVLPIHAPTS